MLESVEPSLSPTRVDIDYSWPRVVDGQNSSAYFKFLSTKYPRLNLPASPVREKITSLWINGSKV